MFSIFDKKSDSDELDVDDHLFVLIHKSKSKNGSIERSVRAMQINKVGCVIETVVNYYGTTSVSSVFVPNCRVEEVLNEEGEVINRRLVR